MPEARCPNTIHSNYVTDHRCQRERGHEGDCLFGAHATGSPAANCTFQPDCPCGEFPCDIGKDATPDRAATTDQRIEEIREWLADWRAGQFSPSHDEHGWPIEMYGLEQDVEWLIGLVEEIRALPAPMPLPDSREWAEQFRQIQKRLSDG